MISCCLKFSLLLSIDFVLLRLLLLMLLRISLYFLILLYTCFLTTLTWLLLLSWNLVVVTLLFYDIGNGGRHRCSSLGDIYFYGDREGGGYFRAHTPVDLAVTSGFSNFLLESDVRHYQGTSSKGEKIYRKVNNYCTILNYSKHKGTIDYINTNT